MTQENNVLEFYKNVDMVDYVLKLQDLPAALFLEEYDAVQWLTESGDIDQKRVSKLINVVESQMLFRLKQFDKFKSHFEGVDKKND